MSRKVLAFTLLFALTLALTTGIPVVVVVAQEPAPVAVPTVTIMAFVWTFIGALLFILGGWLKKTPTESFSGAKAMQTLIVALIVSLISIAFNIPTAEALALLDQWIAAFLQLGFSTGLIALIEFWRQVIWKRIHPTASPS